MSKVKGVVKQLHGITFAGKTDSNNWVMMDGPEGFGGSGAAIRPKELLLLSLGGCTGSDVASILQKKRIKLDGFEMNIEADMTEEHPKVYTKINVEYVFYGKDIKAADVERAIELSQTKYCGVTAMLEKAMEITHSYRIEESK
ncbi:MAG: osmotically inducible protein OsmC [Ignavibacteria bacterium GWB2_35_6b]|nr:MAG: osmotically inducible protein OsmC [Ignavibacteria bacterium GWB2_35_6b]